MNFLAHIFLSGSNRRIQIGNFMGDGIRGKEYESFHKDIQIGVLLHREIDTFTDAHPVFRASKHRLSPRYNHFSGIIVDMFYDHFLGKNWSRYSLIDLADFTNEFYTTLQVYKTELNEKTKGLMPYMIEQNWLYHYKDTEYLQKILSQMDKRFPYPSTMYKAVADLQKDYNLYQEEFFVFFEELQQFTSKKRDELISVFY